MDKSIADTGDNNTLLYRDINNPGQTNLRVHCLNLHFNKKHQCAAQHMYDCFAQIDG